MEDDRRHEQRFKMAQMIAYDMGREQYIKAKAVDISKDGIGFVSDDYIDPLVTVWLSFSLPIEGGKWHSVESEGYVVDVKDLEDGCRFGVSFSRMDEADRAILRDYLGRLEADSSPSPVAPSSPSPVAPSSPSPVAPSSPSPVAPSSPSPKAPSSPSPKAPSSPEPGGTGMEPSGTP